VLTPNLVFYVPRNAALEDIAALLPALGLVTVMMMGMVRNMATEGMPLVEG
jgi:hypothetical protein